MPGAAHLRRLAVGALAQPAQHCFLSTAKPGALCWHGLRELSRHAREHIKFYDARLPGPSADQHKAPGRAQSTGKRQAPNVPMRMSQTRLLDQLYSAHKGSILLRVRVSCRGRVGSGRTCNLSVAVCLHCVGILSGAQSRSVHMICSAVVRDIVP